MNTNNTMIAQPVYKERPPTPSQDSDQPESVASAEQSAEDEEDNESDPGSE